MSREAEFIESGPFLVDGSGGNRIKEIGLSLDIEHSLSFRSNYVEDVEPGKDVVFEVFNKGKIPLAMHEFHVSALGRHMLSIHAGRRGIAESLEESTILLKTFHPESMGRYLEGAKISMSFYFRVLNTESCKQDIWFSIRAGKEAPNVY